MCVCLPLENTHLSSSSKMIEQCHLVQNFPPVPEILSKILFDPSPLDYSVFFKWSWKIRNLSLYSKRIEHLVKNFPPVSEILSQNQSDPFPLRYSVFFFNWSKKILNWSLWRQIFVHYQLNIAIWFGSSPRGARDVFENSIRPFSIGLQCFFLQRVLENTQFEFMETNICTLPDYLEFSSGYRNAFFSNGLGKYAI